MLLQHLSCLGPSCGGDGVGVESRRRPCPSQFFLISILSAKYIHIHNNHLLQNQLYMSLTLSSYSYASLTLSEMNHYALPFYNFNFLAFSGRFWRRARRAPSAVNLECAV